MKNKAIKLTALGLCALLPAGAVGTVVYALTGDGSETAQDPEVTMIRAEEEEEEADGVFKDETVYVFTDAGGTVQKIVVSDWLKNADGADTIQDVSELSDIENVKGEESYTLDGGVCLWDAQGNDVYYQGEIEKELPVDLTVTYTLDGETVSPEELAGQSGRVTIRFDYTNRQYTYVELGGETVRLYVPFVMLTGVLLDNDRFTNVEVSNGKLLNDGDRTAVLGIAFPGLQENLDLDAELFEIPDYVEITADVTEFELGMTLTLASNEPFSEIDTADLDSIDDLSQALGELTDAMDQLLDGSSQLYDGLCTLLEKSEQLAEGVDVLTAGAQSLETGTEALDEGSAELQSGAAQLYAGLNLLNANSEALTDGARQIFEALLAAAGEQLAAAGLSVPDMTISNYAGVLDQVILSLDETAVYEQALAAVTAAVEEQRPSIQAQVTQAVCGEVTQQVTAAVEEQVQAQVTATVQEQIAAQVILAAVHMDLEDYQAAVAAGFVDDETQAAIEAAVQAEMGSETALQTVEDSTAAQMSSQAILSLIDSNVETQMQSDAIQTLIAETTQTQVEKAIADSMAGETVQAQLTAASEGAQAVIALKASLDSCNSFYLGLQSYTAGVAQAVAGAEALQAGTDSLAAGAHQLYTGTAELLQGVLALQDGVPALLEGVTQLRDGAMQLSDGLRAFNEQGVQALVDAVDGDLDGLAERMRATCDLSKSYRTFSSSDNGLDGQVKFIYRTQAIEFE